MNMQTLQTEFIQRAYDGKWEKVSRTMDFDNKYVYENDAGLKITFVPDKWVTVGVFDYIGELN